MLKHLVTYQTRLLTHQLRFNMNNDTIKSWKCWYTDSNNNITELNSVQHNITDIPDKGLHAMRLWFYKENTSRFISGNSYYIFQIINNNIVDQPSSSVLQLDNLDDIPLNSLIKENTDIPEDISNKIFNIYLESVDPTL